MIVVPQLPTACIKHSAGLVLHCSFGFLISFGVGDRTQQVAKAIPSSLGFSSYSAPRFINKRKVIIANVMGQSATLYRIDRDEFARLETEPSSFNIKRTLGYMTFEQNFEGLTFLLQKLCSESEGARIQEIFFPSDSIGRKVDAADFDNVANLSLLETDSICYLDNDKINSILGILNRIDKHQFLNLYDPKELNDNGVYPCVWHNDNSPNQAFNKRHIEEGYDSLLQLFNEAVEKENLILTFVG